MRGCLSDVLHGFSEGPHIARTSFVDFEEVSVKTRVKIGEASRVVSLTHMS